MKMLFVLVLALSMNVFAKTKNVFEANYALEDSNAVIDIAADGTTVSHETERWTIFNEAGRMEMAQSKIYFDPDHESVVFNSGSVFSPSKVPPRLKMPGLQENKMLIQMRRDRSEVLVNPKDVLVKEVGIEKNGVSSKRAMIVPFPNLQVHSSASYTITRKTKPLVPGVFSQTFIYGREFPELDGTVIIHSKKPLVFHAIDPHNHLNITTDKTNGTYNLTIEVVRYAFGQIKEEGSPLLSDDLFPRVDVAIATSWDALTKPIAAEYEKELVKPLPKEFQAIAHKASSLKSDDEKFNSIINDLNSKMTYAGSWTADKGRFYPRGYQKVVQTRLGDCKDFASSMVGILRSLGYKAHVALTFRGESELEFGRNVEHEQRVPALSYFNHAIVHVITPSGERWLDPTNVVADSATIFSDIAGSPALVLANETNSIVTIPKNGHYESWTDQILVARGDGRITLTGAFSINGEGASQIRSLIQLAGPAASDKIMAGVAVFGLKPQREPLLSYDRDMKKAGDLKVQYDFSIPSTTLTEDIANGTEVYYPFRYVSYLQSSKDRVTDLDLGPVGESKAVTHIKAAKFSDDAESDCYAPSKWIDLKRTVTAENGGVRVEDKLVQKVDRITRDDMKSEEFEYFMSDLHACVANPYVRFAPPKPDPKATLLSSLDLDKIDGLLFDTGPDSGAAERSSRKYLDDLIQREPKNARALGLRGAAILLTGYRYGSFYNAGNLEAAEHDLTESLRLNPTALQPLRTMTRVKYFQKDYASAVTYFNKLRAAFPDDITSARAGSDLALKLGHPLEAEQWLRMAASRAKDDKSRDSAFELLAYFYSDTKNHEKAIESYRHMTKLNRWDSYNLSIQYDEVGDYEHAIQSAQAALVDSPSWRMPKTIIASSQCGKAKELISKAKTEKSWTQARAGIETSLFAGLKEDANDMRCLQTGASYYESLAYDLGEATSADRAAEYYERLVEKTKPDGSVYYLGSDSNMKAIAAQLRQGQTPSRIKGWPHEQFEMWDRARKNVQVYTPPSNRVPATAATTAPNGMTNANGQKAK